MSQQSQQVGTNLEEKLRPKRGVTEQIKKMLEEGKSDDEIIAWIEKNLPHVKNPKAYLRAAKSYIRRKMMQTTQEGGGPSLPIKVVQEQPPQLVPTEKIAVKEEAEEEEEAPPPIEVDESVLATMYKGIFSMISMIVVGEEIVLPEAKAMIRAKALKRIIEKHGLGELPWEELSLLGGIAEDAMFLYAKIKEKRAKEAAKSALGAGTEEKREEEKKEAEAIRPDLKELREKMRQLMKRV